MGFNSAGYSVEGLYAPPTSLEVFVSALALFLHAHIDVLGQHLVGLRYARSGLADELLPSRQREPLLRKAAEVLG